MPLQETSGNVTADAYGGGVALKPNYIEDVFSTYLYNGNSSTQTITNGIDLAGKGGMVWLKRRSSTGSHFLQDSVRGISYTLSSDTTGAQVFNDLTSSFNNNGFGLYGYDDGNLSGQTFASWTFRKQPKFFDVVTYTGNNAARTIAHSLGSVPACIIIKRTDSAASWFVYHTSLGATKQITLNSTSAQETTINWNNTSPTSTVFSLGGGAGLQDSNINGATYVAYLFASDSGGFGLTGTDNVISCGSFTTDGSGFATVNLGYEAQWALVKKSSATGAWAITDNMRGWVTGAAVNTSDDLVLFPNTTNADTTQGRGYPTATGFSYADSADSTYIYIAIRRGPMKVPTTGTSVFTPQTVSGSASAVTVTAGFPTDLLMVGNRGLEQKFATVPRLIGRNAMLTWSTAAESTSMFGVTTFTTNQNSVVIQNGDNKSNATGQTYVDYMFRRASSFFDVVCHSATSTGQVLINHNLGVAPEFIIKKARKATTNWMTWASSLGAGVVLDGPNTTGASYTNAGLCNTLPTSTQFQSYEISTGSYIDYVYYLFATCAGVSKVGSYTGTGATQTISCGFTGGARFVLIKRTDDIGDWYVWDSARGMVSGTDPRLALNNTDAETNANWVYTATGGFQIVTTDASVNASGGTYIFLAIA